jgi:hypothetical protein
MISQTALGLHCIWMDSFHRNVRASQNERTADLSNKNLASLSISMPKRTGELNVVKFSTEKCSF